MARKIIPVVILLVAAVIGVSWFVPLFGFSVKSFFNHQFRYAGTVEATKVDVPARVSSVVATVAVQEGDAVKQGQVILKLSCEDLRIAADKATADYDRVVMLRKANAATVEEFDRIKAAYDDAKLRQSWCEVPSPLTGSVLTRYHEPGEQVAPGTKLFTLADLREVWAYVYVPQTLLAQIKVGMDVDGHLPELGDQTIPGRVIKINDEAEFTPKNVQTRQERTRLVYGVKVLFPNGKGLLKPGMPIEVALPEPVKGE
ncbi:MAG TPA: efflux RND transporter periplasmic adaptor subunit [bacterium]